MKTSVVDYIELHAQEHPDNIAFRYLLDGEDDVVEFTYKELRSKARALAKKIRSKVAEGDRVLLLYSPGPDFIFAFIACMYAGVIAVPTYPPIPRRLNIDTVRLELVCDNSKPQLILADKTASNLLSVAMLKESAKNLLGRFFSFGKKEIKDLELSKTPIYVTEGIKLTDSEDFERAKLEPDQIAMLQYSSGSTGEPKGVIVTHRNLVSNIHAIADRIKVSKDASWISWLPHYHDMGLIGLMLLPFTYMISVTYLSPFSFLEKPLRWFKAIQKYKGSYTCSPNFGFELALKHYQRKPDPTLDISSLDYMVCGAEPINPDLPNRLYETFHDIGFRLGMFTPVYGLAEHTLMVSGGEAGRDPIVKSFDSVRLRNNQVSEFDGSSTESTKLISCGFPLKDHVIRIVDPSTKQILGDQQLGEIWATGASVAKGYWAKPEVSEEVFNAFTSDGQGPFLRTGDMGFIIDNELFIFGRIKDIIIVRGKKYAPQDIEISVQNSHEGIRKGNVAAFGITIDNEERLVVVAEKSDSADYDNQEIYNKIIQHVSGEIGISTYEIVLIKPRTIQKTTSGKIQRLATKESYLNNSLQTVGNWKSPLAASKALAHVK